MRRWIPCLALVAAICAAVPARAQPNAAADQAKRYHSFEAEVISANVDAMTLTVKVDGEERTTKVSPLAKARLSEVKPGERVALSCKDVEGEHSEIVSIRPSGKAGK